MIVYSVKFDARELSGGMLSVLMRLSLKRQGRHDFYLSRRLTRGQWNGGEPTDKATAALMRDYARAIEEIMSRYELIERRVPLLSEVVRDFDEARGYTQTAVADKPPTVDDLWLRFMSAQGERNGWTHATNVKFFSLLHHIQAYAPSTPISSVDDAWMQGLASHLRDVAHFKNTTLARNIAFTRWFLRWAANNGFYAGNCHESFKPRYKGISVESRDIIYLTRDELSSLQNAALPRSKPYLSTCRDIFVFCCFSGLRFSDAQALRKCDVYDSHICVTTQKTADALSIDLNSHSRAILEKYADTPSDFALPRMANQRTNKYLKELGRLAGLDHTTRYTYYVGNERREEFHPKYELLTTHCARRTFVVLALQLGIAPEVIMRWTGHSSYDAMKPYMEIVDDLKRRSMSKFDLI
jgi:integrase